MTMRQITTRASGEAGFALVEALVAATILIGVALATLLAVERAQTTTRLSKDRSTAAALAEQAQERMRALPATALANFRPTTTTATVGGIDYQVTSTSDWYRDANGGTQNCTSDTTQADYLKVSTTVTSTRVGTDIKPVTLTSFVTPPLAKRGTLAVKVTNTRGAVQGQTVTISGPTSAQDTTNAAGCAVFGYIPSGQYHVVLNTPGWVDPSGTTLLDKTKTVSDGNLSVQSFEYDRAATVTVKYETLVSGTASPSRGWSATGANSGVPGSGLRPYYATAPPQASVLVQSLYPFQTNYEMFSGECAAANPRTAVPDPNWFTTGIGAGDALIVAPGDTTPVVTVRQPPLNLTVLKGASNPIKDADVVLTPVGASAACTVKPTLTTDTNGRATKSSYDFGGTAGTVAYDPGVPFGVYSVCADAVVGGRNRYATLPANLAVTQPTGNTAQSLTITSSSPSGNCS